MSDYSDRLLEYALREAGEIKRPQGRSQSYTEIARAFLRSGNRSRGLEALQMALQAAGPLKPEERARQLAEIAAVYAGMGDTGQAVDLFKKAELLARATETISQQSGAMLHIASKYAAAGMSAEAEAVLSRLHDLVTTPESGADVAGELIDIAGIYLEAGLPGKAGVIIGEALQIAEAIEDNWIRAERLLEIAQRYSDMDDRVKAGQTLDEALQTVDRIDRAGRTYFLTRIADTFIEMESLTRAEVVLSTALGIVNTDEPPVSLSGNFIEIARRLADLGNNPRAEEVLDLAMVKAEEIEDDKDRIARFIAIAGFQEEIGAAGKARELADRAYSLCARITDNRTLIYLLGNLTLLYSKLKAKEKANEAVDRITRIVQDTNVKTVGLSASAEDLADAGEVIQSLRLVPLIREPEAKSHLLARIGELLAESLQGPGADLQQVIQEIIPLR